MPGHTHGQKRVWCRVGTHPRHNAKRQRDVHLILLSVRKRIHCGMGRFCLAFFASFCLIRNVFWEGCVQHMTRVSMHCTKMHN